MRLNSKWFDCVLAWVGIIAMSLPLSGQVITPTQRYLNLPVQSDAPVHLVQFFNNGVMEREFNIHLATTATDFYAFMDLTNFYGQTLQVLVDSQPATSNQLNQFIQSGTIADQQDIYHEGLRPLFHYTCRRGYIQDPNGLVYNNGEYQLAYQHNPYGWLWDNISWGHAVSSNLVQWQELPEEIYPSTNGECFSGCSVVDAQNTAGFGSNALVSLYTAAGGYNASSQGQPFTIRLVYSLDNGFTWTEYPTAVLQQVVPYNHDPMVFWFAPQNKWVMVLYLNGNNFGIFESFNLKTWAQDSTFTFPGVAEMPNLFPLPLDGNVTNMQWVFFAGLGDYCVGQFSGYTFTQQSGHLLLLRQGNSVGAPQTFNNIPVSDGRRIMETLGTTVYEGMPFNHVMQFPIELTLHSSGSGPVLYANPVKEVSLLRVNTNSWPAQSLVPGVDPMARTTGDGFELDVQFQPAGANQIVFNLRGVPVTYNNFTQQLSCQNQVNTLVPSNGIVHLHMLVDRGTIEIYANDGQLYMPMWVLPVSGARPVGISVTGYGAQLVSLYKYDLGSAYLPASTNAPTIITFNPASNEASPVVNGGQAFFSVTASGAPPLSYQWRKDGIAIPGAVGSTFQEFPATLTNNGNYDVVVSNSFGSVTSSVAPLTVISPYPVARWSMTPTGGNLPAVLDSDTNPGQGTKTGTGSGGNNVPVRANDNLATLNDLGNAFNTGTDVPPVNMFANDNNGGGYSYNAEAIKNVNGTLFFQADWCGDEMDFTGPFTIEMFFKTDGNGSGAGPMQLLNQGDIFSRYGILVNATGPGSLTFTVNNGITAQSVSLASTNFADGQWHYLYAVYDTLQGATGALQLTVLNRDLTELSAATDLPSGFGPLPSITDGILYIGRNTYAMSSSPRTFLGLIDEVQISSGVNPITNCIGALSIGTLPRITQWSNAPVTVNLGGVASFSVSAAGVGPLYYQWYRDGQPICGATNSTLSIFPVTGTNANLDVVVNNASGSATSSVVALTVLAPYPIAYWRMESQITAPNNVGVPTWPGIADSDTNSGQGIYTTGTLPAAIDDLITFNGLPGQPVTLSTNVAPGSMFVNGHNAGNYSYDAEAITNVDGCLFFPQDQYGDEMDFTGPFSIELFFKTEGNQSGVGKMELISQGTDTGQTFRYGIDVNEAGPGGIRFKIANSSLSQTNVVDLTGANYADGQWHYLLAVCDTMAGTNGQMRLTIVNQDGSEAQATNNLPAGFLPLPAEDNGNLFLGRYTYPVSVNPETFLGFIDEVQITAGVEPDSWRVGKIPSIDNYPRINGVSAGTNGVSFQWTGAAANGFLVQWVARLGDVWQTIATLPSSNSITSYVDTNASRLTNPVGFYRTLAQ